MHLLSHFETKFRDMENNIVSRLTPVSPSYVVSSATTKEWLNLPAKKEDLHNLDIQLTDGHFEHKFVGNLLLIFTGHLLSFLRSYCSPFPIERLCKTTDGFIEIGISSSRHNESGV